MKAIQIAATCTPSPRARRARADGRGLASAWPRLWPTRGDTARRAGDVFNFSAIIGTFECLLVGLELLGPSQPDGTRPGVEPDLVRLRVYGLGGEVAQGGLVATGE